MRNYISCVGLFDHHLKFFWYPTVSFDYFNIDISQMYKFHLAKMMCNVSNERFFFNQWDAVIKDCASLACLQGSTVVSDGRRLIAGQLLHPIFGMLTHICSDCHISIQMLKL